MNPSTARALHLLVAVVLLAGCQSRSAFAPPPNAPATTAPPQGTAPPAPVSARCPAAPTQPVQEVEVLVPKRRLQVGDDLHVGLRPRGRVDHDTRLLGLLSRPDGTVLRGRSQLDPVRAVEVFQGCDPVPGDPDSCKGGPYQTHYEGGGDVSMVFEGDPLVLHEPGEYRLELCGVDGRVVSSPQTFRVAPGRFDELFPPGEIAGFRPMDRKIFRFDPEHPRYQITYVRSSSGPKVEAIVAPFPDPAEAKAQMGRISAWGKATSEFGRTVEAFRQGDGFRVRWVTARGLVHLEFFGVSLPDARAVVQRFLQHHPPT